MAEAWVYYSSGGQASEVMRIGSEHRWGLPTDGDQSISEGMCLDPHCVTRAQHLCQRTLVLMGLKKGHFSSVTLRNRKRRVSMDKFEGREIESCYAWKLSLSQRIVGENLCAENKGSRGKIGG